MPKGIFMRPLFCTFRKLTKMPCAVSGRRYNVSESSMTLPILVANIRLNCLTSVQLRVPLMGHTISRSRISCFNPARSLRFMQSA